MCYSLSLRKVVPSLFSFPLVEFGKFSYKVIIAGLFLCITVIWLAQVFRYKNHHVSCHFYSPFEHYFFTLYLACHMQLQKAVKLLDSGAVRATRFLWRYPTARVILFFYLVRSLNWMFKMSYIWDEIPWKDLNSLLILRNCNRCLYISSWCISYIAFR